MRKTFKYRMYPTKGQVTKLEQTLKTCCWLYNHFVDERKTLWETKQESVSRFTQINRMVQMKKTNEYLQNVSAPVLQNVAARVDLAYRAFFLRIKKGQTPGYPRFKSHFRYDSFTHPYYTMKLYDSYVRLNRIGNVKIRKHRPIQGNVKTCTVRRTKTNKWFVTFAAELPDINIKQSIEPSIGLDLGVSTFIARSDGKKISNPRFINQEEKVLKKAQQKFSKQKKGSPERRKARKVVARIHERISNKRNNFAHQESRKLINEFNTIIIEDLKINKMLKDGKELNKPYSKSLNKSISNVAWSMLTGFLSYKAEEAGKKIIKVNPAYTSQTCSKCGNRHKLKLSERTYKCPTCGLSLDRDINASINIKTLGMQSFWLEASKSPT